MRSPKNFVGGEPGAPGSPSARRRLPLGRSPRLVGSARFDLGGRARLNLGARQLGDEAVGRAHRAMIDFGERHIVRSEEHTSELQSLMRISYAVFCLKKKKTKKNIKISYMS